MRDFLERSFVYRIFLRIRPRFLSDEKLLTRLSKRGHNLDKALSQNADNKLCLFELMLLSKEYFRRKLKPSDVTKWAWDLVYRAQLGLGKTGPESEQAVNDASFAKADISKVMTSRRSVRKWEAKRVSIKEIIDSIDLAKWAPSSCNRQVWKFLIVEKKEDKDLLHIFTHQSFFKDAPFVIVPLVNMTDYHKEIKHYAYLDTGAVIQNLLLSLHSKGLGACWIGIKHDKHYENNANKFRAYFHLDQNIVPLSLIPVGRYSEIPKAPPRKDTPEIIIDHTISRPDG